MDEYDKIKSTCMNLLAEFGVSNFKSLRTSDGLAFVGIINYKGKPVGSVENSGTGGADLVRIYGERYYETQYDASAQVEAKDAWNKVREAAGASSPSFNDYYLDEIISDALLTKAGF